MHAIRFKRASRKRDRLLVVTVIGALCSLWILDDAMSSVEWIGIATISIGVIVAFISVEASSCRVEWRIRSRHRRCNSNDSKFRMKKSPPKSSAKSEPILCRPKRLPGERLVEAAQRALEMNPANRPHPTVAARALAEGPIGRERLALVVGRRWPVTGIKLTVAFLDSPPADLQKRILLHMNAWGKTANVSFVAAKTDPKVRIARLDHPDDMAGYWSYVGTEILTIPKREPTLNLEAFTMDTPESEFHRVVRHETGHTLGFPHEHMRKELVDKIDADKAIKYFKKTQGWSAADVKAQVLTPLEDSSLLETDHADPHSIMCYQIPGSITKDGKAIVGGTDIDKMDYAFAASCYPKKVS